MSTPPAGNRNLVALAVAAHPDDIEFLLAGTLLRLRDAGAQIHMWNLSSGACGTADLPREEIIRIRAEEAAKSARIAGAVLHQPIADDLAIFYEPGILARVGSVIREVQPDIILTQPPHDYMEDHQNTCRLVVTAAFGRCMPNFTVDPPRDAWHGPTAIYHSMPHGLRDGMRCLQRPGVYVDIGPFMETKRAMLAQHLSQKEWLDRSQGMGSYIVEMDSLGRTLGRMSGHFEFAEGWVRRLHLGFGPADFDPLAAVLGSACWTDPDFEADLDWFH
jgi:LmbE family N-acetylglucosaminyl deacetylase